MPEFHSDIPELQEAGRLIRASDFSTAESLLLPYLQRCPQDHMALRMMGFACQQQRDFERAAHYYSAAVRLRPDDAEAILGLGAASQENGELNLAAGLYEHMVRQNPQDPRALHNLANCYRDLGRLEEACAVYRASLRIRPDNITCQLSYASALFFKGEWNAAWEMYEARLKATVIIPRIGVTDDATGLEVEMAHWTGGPVPRSLIVFAEQGLGDTLMFARFLPELVRMGCRVTLVEHERMFAVLKTLPLAEHLHFAPRNAPLSISGIDGWVPLLSLPRALGLRPKGFVSDMPYLHAEPARVERWRQVIGPQGFKIGLCWQGTPGAGIDKGRSASLEAFAPLAALPDVRLFALQKGDDTVADADVTFPVTRFGPEFDGGPDAFLDTAAVMMSLDLVVSVDTSVCHLAGALGRPVRLLLKQHGADWRWPLQSDTTPWYPSLRIIRQPRQGDWAGAIDSLVLQVQEMIQQQRQQMLMTPVSAGEVIDKLTILEIKLAHITDAAKRVNIQREAKALQAVLDGLPPLDADMTDLRDQLRQVNLELWRIEDEIRECERAGDFGSRFIALARSVYHTNDRRAALKKQINLLTGSVLVEEKSYAAY